MSQIRTTIFLLLATLAFASPINPSVLQDTLSVLPQDSTATSPTFLSIPTITFDILQPPYVSLHSLTARDGQESRLTSTTTTTTTEIPTSTIATFALQSATSSTVLQVRTDIPVATSSSALQSETEVSASASSSGLYSETGPSAATFSSVQHNGTTASSVQQTGTETTVATSTDSGHAPTATVKKAEWDCTALCGELNKDGECTSAVGCVEKGDVSEKVKGMKPPHTGSASSSGVSRERAGTVFALVVLAGMLL